MAKEKDATKNILANSVLLSVGVALLALLITFLVKLCSEQIIAIDTQTFAIVYIALMIPWAAQIVQRG